MSTAPTPRRALLLVHGPAGSGEGRARAKELLETLAAALGVRADVALRVVEDHDAVRAEASAFAAAVGSEGLLLAGGGGGTLRAVVEGCMEHGGVTPIAPLRLGSGNLLAKRLGFPRDPRRAVVEAAHAFSRGRLVGGGVLRAHVGRPDGGFDLAYATALCGLGVVGEVPEAVTAFKRHCAAVHRPASRLMGLERVNDLEYAGCFAERAARALASPSRAPLVDVRTARATTRMRLLAGVGLAFAVPNVPLAPGVDVEDEDAALFLLPLGSRLDTAALMSSPGRASRDARRLALAPGRPVELLLVDRDRAPFFLDEDPLVFHGRLRLEAGGLLPFVPGRAFVSSRAVASQEVMR